MASPSPRSNGSTSEHSAAADLRGFGPLGIAAFLIILLVGPAWFRGALVLIWAKFAWVPRKDLGFVAPRNWILTILLGLALGISLKFVLKGVVMPLLGADPVNHTYHYLAGNRAAIPGMLFTIILGAGFGEETVFRGYLFERLSRLFGRSPIAQIAIILLSSALFALAHYADQGTPGVEQALITGLVFAAVFAVCGQIWIVMLAHAAFDLTALAMIYYNVESDVAHLLFR